MTRDHFYSGLPVSEGMATGQLFLGGGQRQARSVTAGELTEAFATVAAQRSALAEKLREEGRTEQAGIVAIGALIAADPALVNPAVAAVEEGEQATVAVERSAAAQAAALAALDHPDLAARADDVRQVANAVLAHLAGGGPAPPPAGDFILVQREVDPADLIRYAEAGLTGAVCVSGGASSHAAIIARGLGLPMLAGADPAVLTIPAGLPAALDGTAGRLIVGPSVAGLAPIARPGTASSTQLVTGTRVPGGGQTTPADATHRTADGQEITLLCNVASVTETRRGLAAGAAGVGLLRTEIPFVSSAAWPSEADHRSALDPVLGLLTGRPAVVRLLDFSGDKVPAFLAAGPPGLTALLQHPAALDAQLRAVLGSGQDTLLRIMVPMVTDLDEMAQVRAALTSAAPGAALPPLGMMMEVAATAEAAGTFAPAVDFFSIGTNDLTSEVLGIARDDPRMRPELAAHPRVLALISRVVRAADDAGIPVSVCGDAAADPAVLPLLIGVGVRTLSVGAARLPAVAELIAQADTAQCADLAAQAVHDTAQARQGPAQIPARVTTP